jgi:hypothetical protein
MSDIKKAFDNLLNTIAAETERKFNELNEKTKDKRITQLEQDLATLKAREKKENQEAWKDFNQTKE